MKITVRPGVKSLQKAAFVLISFLLTLFFFLNPFYKYESGVGKNADNYREAAASRTQTRNDNHNVNTNFLISATDNQASKDLKDLERYTKEELISHLRNHHLTPPAPLNERYNLSVKYPHYDDHNQFHIELLDILKKYHKLESGFFVEAGALDGHYLSHSLDLEMLHQWNGLLVEASPNLTRQLRSKRRKCWSSDVCLIGEPYMKIDYMAKKDQQTEWKRGNGKINPLKYGMMPRQFEGHQEYQSEGEVECFSLFSLLTALNIQVVDLLVLDIEGHEFQVLSNYPFDVIPIKVVAVEHWLIPMPSEMLKLLMFQKGYALVYESSSDYVFVLKT